MILDINLEFRNLDMILDINLKFRYNFILKFIIKFNKFIKLNKNSYFRFYCSRNNSNVHPCLFIIEICVMYISRT